MHEVQSQIERLEAALNHLVAEHLVLKNENRILKSQLSQSEENLRLKQVALESKEMELHRLKLASGLGANAQDTGPAKAKLNSLMREIDRCIAMLND